MEDGFMLAKELGQTWSEVTNMASRERNWLLERLERYYKDRTQAIKKEARTGRRGSGLTIED